MKKRHMVGRLVRRVLAKRQGSLRKHKPTGLTGLATNEQQSVDTDVRQARIEYGDGADIVATDDKAVLVGMVGLKLGLEPRGRMLIVNHWATWCDGCIDELPLLLELRSATRDIADFVGVGWEGFSGGGTPGDWVARVDEASREHGLSWSTMVFEGKPEELFANLDFEVRTVPQTWVIGVDGVIRYRVHGAPTVQDIDAILEIAGVSK